MLTRASAVLEKNLKASKQEAVQEALVKLTSTLTTVTAVSFMLRPTRAVQRRPTYSWVLWKWS